MAVLFLIALATLAVACVAGSGDDETRAARRWVEAALLRQPPEEPDEPGIFVRRQDYGEFAINRSVMNTPLQIGDKHYDRGLGSHSISEVLVRLPGPGREFTAEVGVDNNYDTQGKRGSVIFAVDVAGKQVLQTEVLRGGMAPVPVRVDLAGAREFVLHILDAGDGVGWDQSDWAEAQAVLADGERRWLDEMAVSVPTAVLSTAIPFSFTYGGKPSAELLPTWEVKSTTGPAADGKRVDEVTYTDPATGLEITCEVTRFDGFPAAEWVLRLRNAGSQDTPIIENLRPLDLDIAIPTHGGAVFHHAHGSLCQADDFLPIDEILPANADLKIAPRGGRSSNGAFPFFNMQWNGGGLIGAIGWSGQWELDVKREANRLNVEAGQQTTHFVLHPGESIRTPRMLLVWWDGDDYLRGQNTLRRLILAHYTPLRSGEPIVPPLTANTWFAFEAGNAVTEANQLESIESMAPLGVEDFWIDAGWFEGGWPAGAGSWVPKPDAFPRGLKPLGDAAHAKGMGLVVWFEPERVCANSRIANEHPEFVLHAGPGDGLFNLGDPAACAWLTDHLSKCISDWGIDIFRNDFNIDPLPFWQAADAPDRQGITEIRYIENLYKMWDDLRRRNPGLAIDNCASGGRRIDLEMISRSFPLWRTDWTSWGRTARAGDQVHTAGLSLWIPLHSTGVSKFDPYTFRSVTTTGVSICPDTRDPAFPAEQARKMLAEAKGLRPLWLGDYYPLLPITLDETQWCGWQFDRPDLGEGFAMLFRRAESPYTAIELGLRGLDPEATYEVRFEDTGEVRRLQGSDAAALRIEIPDRRASMLLRYRRL